MSENSNKGNRTSEQKNIYVLAMILVAILIGLYMILRTCSSIPERGAKALTEFSKIFATKERFFATFGPIVSESEFKRLQFYQRNQVCFFRIIRYRSANNEKLNFTQFIIKENEKKKPEDLPILLKQYCIWEAKGTYEFNFFVDIANLDKWDYDWNEKEFTLTLYPPDIEANTPAELEAIVFTKVADSVSIDEGYTKKLLQEAITSGIDGEKSLKEQLSENQKKFFYEQARKSIKETYIKFFAMIPNIKIEKYPEIKVIFPHERKNEIEKSKRSKL